MNASQSSLTYQLEYKKQWFFERRTLLPLTPTYFWQIKSGVVRTATWLEDGTMITIGLWGSGEVVGTSLTRINPYHMECLTPVQTVAIPLADSYQSNTVLLLQMQQLEELTVIRAHRKIDLMLLKLLSWLGQKFGRKAASGQLIDLRLTHQDLADILGATRVTITRTLNQLEQQGFIERLPLHRIVLREEEMWHYQI